jgi:hypothetical protein
MELTKTNFLNSKNIPLQMIVSYEKDKLNINGDKTEYRLYVTFYLRREGENKNGFMLSRYYLDTLLEGDFARGLCLEGSNPDKYFVDKEDMKLFRAEYRIIKKVVNKFKEPFLRTVI